MTALNNNSSTDRQGQANATDTVEYTDYLGIERYTMGLANFIKTCDVKDEAVTISLQGTWGSGKTYLFNLVKKQIEEEMETKVHFLSINTWQYAISGQENHLVEALINKVFQKALDCNKELKEKYNKYVDARRKAQHNESGSTRKKFDKAGFVPVAMDLLGIIGTLDLATAVFAGLITLAIDINNVVHFDSERDESEQEGSTNPNEALLDDDSFVDIETLRQNLEKLLEPIWSKGERLVIFIDDLDRLDPEKAVELLEGVKNFLDIKGCVYVLAIDKEVVFEGIIQKYGEKIGQERKELFFDKIIKAPFVMPVDTYDVKKFYKEKLSKIMDGKLSPENDEDLLDLYFRVTERFMNHGVIHRNPRSMIRYLTLLELHASILNTDAAPEDDRENSRVDNDTIAFEETARINPQRAALLFCVLVFDAYNHEAFEHLRRILNGGEEVDNDEDFEKSTKEALMEYARSYRGKNDNQTVCEKEIGSLVDVLFKNDIPSENSPESTEDKGFSYLTSLIGVVRHYSHSVLGEVADPIFPCSLTKLIWLINEDETGDKLTISAKEGNERLLKAGLLEQGSNGRKRCYYATEDGKKAGIEQRTFRSNDSEEERPWQVYTRETISKDSRVRKALLGQA